MPSPLPARHLRVIALLGALFAPCDARAQSPAWDPTQPRGQTREIDFTTSEGTWTSVDVSPDGSWIVFDLLGHIYRLPIAGGEAQNLTQSSGIAMNVQPRISPDGKSIAFISDRRGQMNVWVMDADGGNPSPVYLDDKYEYRWPSWTADARFLVAVRQGPFTVGGFNSLMLLNRSGGSGIELHKGESGRNPFRTSVSRDGRYAYSDLYTSAANVPAGRRDVLRGSIQLQRLDIVTGLVTQLTAGQTEKGNADFASSGGAFAAEPSPDGRSLAFMRKVPGGTLNYKGQRYGPRPALWIRDLVSGGERLVMDPVEMDLSEASFALDGTYPSYAWMPDSKRIVIHQGGKIRRLDVMTGAVSTISYTARVHRVISEQPWVDTRLSDGPVEARFIRWASSSPDGRTLAFQSLGRIWLVDRPNGTPRRLTSASFTPFEFQPAWSPDGRSIAFTTWQDQQRGAVWVASVGGGAPRRLTPNPGEYVNPVWTPDGRALVVTRGAGATARGQTMLRNPYYDLVQIPIGGGEEQFIVQVPRGVEPYGRKGELVRATVGANGRVYFSGTYAPGSRDGVRPYSMMDVESVRMDGSDRIVHARVANGGDASISPDGKWLAYTQGMNAYLAPLPANGTARAVPTINRRGGDLQATALSMEGGIDPTWRSAGVVEFSSGNKVFAYNVDTRRVDTTSIRLTAPRDVAAGSIALTGARILTMDRRQVIERGNVVIRAGRITCVGQCAVTGIDRVVDASGKTIIPGFIDLHAHHEHEHLGLLPAHNFETSVYLAYGVTTTFDPSPTSTDPFPAGELVETGQMVGPRIFTSGETFMFGDDPASNDINSLEAALRDVARRKSWGVPMLKQYLLPTRQQRQWVVEAARRLGVRTTAEGSADLYHKLTLVMDGHTGGEHLTVQAPLYSDVLTFMAKARFVYSHTPLVSGYGAWNDEFFWQERPLWQDTKLQRWIPWRELIPHTRRFITRPETDYSKDVVAQVATDLVASGGLTAIGSHGQQHGLGSHWDVWMLAKAAGAMTALEVATNHGATFLGVSQDLGSITAGKLADLVVLNGNPLDDIRKTADIRYVMKAGLLYDATTLDELWPRQVKYGDYYWVMPEMFRVDEKRVDVPGIPR